MQTYRLDNSDSLEEMVSEMSEDAYWRLVLVEQDGAKASAIVSAMATGESVATAPSMIPTIIERLAEEDSIIVRIDPWRWQATEASFYKADSEAREIARRIMKTLEGTKRTHEVADDMNQLVTLCEWHEKSAGDIGDLLNELEFEYGDKTDEGHDTNQDEHKD